MVIRLAGTDGELIMQELKKQKKFSKTYLFIGIIVILIVLFALLKGGKKNKEINISEYSSVQSLCELSTLKAYYHNVVECEKSPSGIFKYGFFKVGYKKMWIEYEGYANVGIDASEVKISEPDSGNNIKIYVPEAKVLDTDADIDSIEDPILETGLFTSITLEEKAQAYSVAQTNMREEASADTFILSQARENGKEVLKQYVINLGRQIGKEYTVTFSE